MSTVQLQLQLRLAACTVAAAAAAAAPRLRLRLVATSDLVEERAGMEAEASRRPAAD